MIHLTNGKIYGKVANTGNPETDFRRVELNAEQLLALENRFINGAANTIIITSADVEDIEGTTVISAEVSALIKTMQWRIFYDNVYYVPMHTNGTNYCFAAWYPVCGLAIISISLTDYDSARLCFVGKVAQQLGLVEATRHRTISGSYDSTTNALNIVDTGTDDGSASAPSSSGDSFTIEHSVPGYTLFGD